MAMFASESGSRPPMASIDMTPLIGVLIALLLMFFLSVPSTGHIDRAATGGFGESFGPAPISVSIKQTGELYWNGGAINRLQLGANLADLAREIDVPMIVVHAESTVKYEQLISVLSAIQREHLRRFTVE